MQQGGGEKGSERRRVEKASGNTLRCTTGKYKKKSLEFFFLYFLPFCTLTQRNLSSFLREKKKTDSFGCLEADTWMLCAE